MLHFVFPSIYLFIPLNPLSFNSLHRFREYHQFIHFVLSPLGDKGGVCLWELLTTYVEGVESVGAIGSVLEEVFFRLGKLFATLIFVETIATTSDARSLDSQDEVVIVLTVEERHQGLLPGKTLVDEKVLLVMAHWVAEVDINDLPPVRLELFLYHIVEVLVIHGIVGAFHYKSSFEGKRLGITVFQPRLKVRTFARTNSYEYGKQRQVQESA